MILGAVKFGYEKFNTTYLNSKFLGTDLKKSGRNKMVFKVAAMKNHDCTKFSLRYIFNLPFN